MSSTKRILIVDDEPSVLTLLCDLFHSVGWDIQDASSGADAIEKIERGRYDVILTDMKMPGPSGIEVLRTAKKIQSDAEVVLMTGYATVDTAIEAMRAGAFHYLMKPFKGEEVINLVEKAYAQRQLRRENQLLKSEFRGEFRIQSVVGTSPAIQEALSAIQRLADTDTPVLLVGERGNGRAFHARVIHSHSSRVNALFVSVYCAGLQEDMLMDELFGHDAGAYQQATLPVAGKMELANHGTLYLADIGDAPPRVQERILRFLTARTIAPVGSDREIELDVRIVASVPSPEQAGSRDTLLPELRDAFAPGSIPLAPLRERAEDIPLLLHHFLFESNRERKKPLQGFSQAAMRALSAYSWPGNVRELRDLVRSISQKKKQGAFIDATDLPVDILYGRKRRRLVDESPPARAASDIVHAIEDIEKPMVLQALALADRDRERAAELLNISPSALGELMKRHRIEA